MPSASRNLILFINLDQRTYRLVHGWPPCPQVKTGPMNDLAGGFNSCRSINSKYRVGIVWKADWQKGRKWYVMVGRPNCSGKADRLAEETAAALSLPLVEPPLQLQSTTSMRNGLS
jgi:hypothetical protein